MKKMTRNEFLKLMALTCGVSATSALVGCGEKEEDASDAVAKIAVVFGLGGLGDKSFNDSIAVGLERAVEEYGISYQYVEPKEIAEFEGNIREFARSGDYDLIVSVGFDQADPLSAVSEEFPEQKFLILDGYVDGRENVSSISFSDDEKCFLVGTLAGLSTTANKIGIVGGMDIPLINKFAAGYMAGAANANPDCVTSVKYVGSWSDANTAKEIALSLYNEGCDIVMAAAGSSGLGVFAAAKEAGKYAIGADVDQIYIDPSCIIASAVRALDQVVVDEIGDVLGDTFVGGPKELGLKDNAVTYAYQGSEIETPQEVIDAVEQVRQEIIDGAIEVPETIEEAQAFIANLG